MRTWFESRLRLAVTLALVIASEACLPPDDEAATLDQSISYGMSFEGEAMARASGKQSVEPAAGASGSAERVFWGKSKASTLVQLPAASTGVVVRARGDQCQGPPRLQLAIDGTEVLVVDVTSEALTDYPVQLPLEVGAHEFVITFPNDYWDKGLCDRNLRVDLVTATPRAPDAGTQVDAGAHSDAGNEADGGSSFDGGKPTDAGQAHDAGPSLDAGQAHDGGPSLDAGSAPDAGADAGSTCVPTSCAAQGKNCGGLFDGCSKTLDCGSCTSPETCGGGGVANVCGSSGGDVVLAAVGDINGSGVYGPTTNPGRTAQSIANINPQYFLGLGDFQYTQGTTSAILGGYDKNFGALKSITRPIAGPTHDVASATDQLGYLSYWGRDAFQPYSWNVGSWHLVALPSAALRYGVNTAGILAWLQADLAANTLPCTLAFWHEPYWSRSTSNHPTGSNGILTPAVRPWLDELYAHGAELILTGHQHNYQRFAPMRPDGTPDANGLRQFVVGSGGIGFYTFNGATPNVEASNDNTYGVLKVTLHAGSYDWSFIPNTAGGFTDTGSGTCH